MTSRNEKKTSINSFEDKSRILLDYQTNIFHLLDGYLNEEFGGHQIKNWNEIAGINTVEQLQQLEKNI